MMVGDDRRALIALWLRFRGCPMTTVEVAVSSQAYPSGREGRSRCLTDLLALSAASEVRLLRDPSRPVRWCAT